jgi:hypothetical protein
LHVERLAEDISWLLRRAVESTLAGPLEGDTKQWMNRLAKDLAARVEASFGVLTHMRMVLYEESRLDKLTGLSKWKEWLGCWRETSRRRKALALYARRPTEEHFKRLHLFGNDKGSGKPCDCLNYA